MTRLPTPKSRSVFALLLLWLVCLPLVGFAATERYDYDALGRLIRYINQQGLVTRYHYDPVGNILAVETGTQAQPPSITSIIPSDIRRSESKPFIASGSSLNGAKVSSPDLSLDISGLSVSSNQLRFTLSAGELAPLGQQSFSVSTAEGSTSFAVTVNPQLPTILISPLPIAIPPDRTPYEFVVRLSNEDNISHTISLAVSDPTILQLTTTQVTIPAGTLEVRAKITGLQAGIAAITATSNLLKTTVVPVFVTTEFAGINFAVSANLGVVLEPSVNPGAPLTVSPLVSPLLGVALGPVITGVQPRSVSIGSGPLSLVITGAGLGSVNGVSAIPNTGLTFGTPIPATDGTSVTVPLTVAADAPTMLRQVTLDGPNRPYVAASPLADRLLVTEPRPEIFSIDPLFATPGTTGLAFTVRGTKLGGLQSIDFSPPTGITVGSSPSVNAEGTVATTSIEVTPNAPIGSRVVTAVTSGGTSSAAQSEANTFSVVTEVKERFTPIVSSAIGILKEGTAEPQPSSYGIYSYPVGVTRGPVATAIIPPAGSIGETVSLEVRGNQLGEVTALQMLPDDGLAIGPISVGAQGSSLTVSLRIDAAAPQTVRRMKLLAGAVEIPFAPPEASRFQVAAKLPFVTSVSPIVMEIGAAQTQLIVRGSNLQGATAVDLRPGDGVVVGSSPQVSPAGDELTVAIEIRANALPGQRVVVVTTPAGESSSIPSPSNVVTLNSGSLGPTITPVSASLLGVIKQAVTEPPLNTEFGPFVAPNVGVVLQDGEAPPPTSSIGFNVAPILGVGFGSVATGAQATSFYRGATGSLTVSGHELNFVNRVSLSPPTGVVLGDNLTVSADGKQVTVSFTVASDAPTGLREIGIGRNTNTVPFMTPETNRLFLGSGVSQILSIEPIASAKGSSFSLLIRGQNLLGTTAVMLEPADGIAVVSAPEINAAGTEVLVSIVIAPDAPVGARVVRVLTPAGLTEGAASPNNTFTVTP